MRRILVNFLVCVFFLVPAISWSAPPFDLINTVKALEARVAELEATVATLQSQTIPGLKDYVTVNTTDQEIPLIIFHGVNIQLVNGESSTQTINGKGNLIIGYDELRTSGEFICSDGQFVEANCKSPNVWALNHKTGSHNLVIGPYHNYSKYGGFVTGRTNTINRDYASVCGGSGNIASGVQSSVSGGALNTASGVNSSVSGGVSNIASGNYSSVSGGARNTASGNDSSISGGEENTASGNYSSISGGEENTASGNDSSIGGGISNIASGEYSSVSGGGHYAFGNTASGYASVVSGGDDNEASGMYSVVSGGSQNTASNDWSTISGGVSDTTNSNGQHVPP